MTLAIVLMETFATALLAMFIIALLLRRGGQKVNWGVCFIFPAFLTLIKAIELEWSIPPLTTDVALVVLLALFFLIAYVRRRRRPA